MGSLEENIKRINNLIKQIEKEEDLSIESEISEEGEGATSTTTSTTTATGYPTVTKWETGLTRGPGNPIGNAKRADKVNRGKGNRLI
jgi:hypothetical protein